MVKFGSVRGLEFKCKLNVLSSSLGHRSRHIIVKASVDPPNTFIDKSQDVEKPIQPVVELLEESAEEKPGASQRSLWIRCIKLPMYTVALAPMVLGCVLTYVCSGVFPASQCGDLCLGGILVIAWLNLSNDAFDARTGVDSGERKPESIVNLSGQPRLVILGISKAFLILGLWTLSKALLTGASVLSACLLASSILCGYIYQGPPFRLSYKGLGEPLCLLAFGNAVIAAFLSATRAVSANPQPGLALLQLHSGLVLPTAAVCGLTITSILFCSHFHQVAGDIAAGKRSPIVKLGTETGCKVLTALAVATHVLALATLFCNAEARSFSALGILAAPFAYSMIQFAQENHHVPAQVAPLKLFAIRWHVAMTAAMFLALFTSGVAIHGAESLV